MSGRLLALVLVGAIWPSPAAAASIGADAASLRVGQPIAAAWTGATAATDWIGLFRLDDGSRPDWVYVNCANAPTGAVPDGSCRFWPALPGTYELRLHAAGTWQVLAVSARITVAPSSAALSLPPGYAGSTLGGGGDVSVSWSGSASAADWIGLFRLADGQRVDFKFTSCGTVPAAAAVASGSCIFVLPPVDGDYEFRMHAGGRWVVIATAGPVTAATRPATVVANPRVVPAGGGVLGGWDGAATGRDWIGLFRRSDGVRVDFQFVSCQPRTGGLPFGSCPFRPPGLGEYEFRLYANNSWYLLATSEPFVVVPP